MARGITNTNVTRMKEEKSRVKVEKSRDKAPARHATDDDDDDDDEPQHNGRDEHQRDAEEDEEHADEDDEEGGDSPRGAKRVRVNDDGDSVPSGSQPASLPKVKTQPRGDDGFVCLTVLRISFVVLMALVGISPVQLSAYSCRTLSPTTLLNSSLDRI